MQPEPILFCSHVVEWGGAETVLADLLAGLDRDRFRPHLLVPGDGPLPQSARRAGIEVHDISIGGKGPVSKALSLPGAARAIRRIAESTGARLVYANTMIAGYAGMLAQRRGLLCLWHVHIVTSSRIARHAAARVTTVVTPSRAAAVALQRDDAEIVQNGVPPAFFEATGTGLRTDLGIAAETLLVGIVGRIDPHKGHEILLRACAEPGAPPFHVVIVGSESFADSQARVRGHTDHLRETAQRLGIEARVHFLGHRDDIATLLPQLDIVAAPSVTTESAPRAIAEAQAAARPVIASKIGGTGEMIRDGITGRLCPPDDPAALLQALRPLLTDPTERITLGKAAQEHARTHYAMPAFTRRIESICERALMGG